MSELPSWYQQVPEPELMPIDPPPDDAPSLREAIDRMHRELVEEAAQRIAQLAGDASWLMVPDRKPIDDGFCTVVMAGFRCTTERAWHIWAGCAQEHLVEGYMCELHLGQIEASLGTHWCAGCRAYNEDQHSRPEAERQPLVSERWMIVRKVPA